MTSFKLTKDFTGNGIYCNSLNAGSLISGSILDLSGNIEVKGNLAVTGNTTALGITARSQTTCAGSAQTRGDTLICSAGPGAGANANTIAFFNGTGQSQVAAPLDVAPVVGAPSTDTAVNDYVNNFNAIRFALQDYGLLG